MLGTRAVLAVGTGYLLGRYRKRQLAIILVTVALAGDVGGIGGQLRRRATHLLDPAGVLSSLSPEAGEIIGTIRGDLLDAKNMATTVLSSRVDSLADRLHDWAQALPNLEMEGDHAVGHDGGDKGAWSADDEPEAAGLPESHEEEEAHQEDKVTGEQRGEPAGVPEPSARAAGARRRRSAEPDEVEESPVRPRRRPARPAMKLPGATDLLGGLSPELREITGMARDEVLGAAGAVRSLVPKGDSRTRPPADQARAEPGP